MYNSYFCNYYFKLFQVVFFTRKNQLRKDLKLCLGKHQMKVLDEWNQNAASYLCNKETDSSEERKLSTFVTFCKRMIDTKDYSKFSNLLIDSNRDYYSKKTIYSNKLNYGKTESKHFSKISNAYVRGNDLGYYNLNPISC